jgi:cytochrome c oxidase subunit 2
MREGKNRKEHSLIFGTRATVDTKDGEKSLVVDGPYIIESILRPDEMIVRGYPPVMPSFEGKIPDKDLDELVRYIKSLTGDSDQTSLH